MPDDDQRTRALEVMAQLFGGGIQGEKMPARDLAPEFFELASTACFGGFWSRPGLAIKERSLATVSQLAALGRTDELKIHLQGARNVGWTEGELIEVLMQTSQYAGIPAAVQALNAAAEVFGTGEPS
ncbi:MAG: carboxymuconolactone decarboxylase family protein [Myxococcota bacterium]